MRNHEVSQIQPLLDEKGNLREPGWSRSLVQQYDRTGSLSDICMEYQKMDGAMIKNGEIDALLVE